jgi:hypothetical protein
MSAFTLWRGGFAASTDGAIPLQKIDAGYLYELGALIRPIRSLGYGDLSRPWAAWASLVSARDAVRSFTDASIYSGSLRSAKMYANKLVEELHRLILRIESDEWKQQTDEFQPGDILPVAQALASFEPVMIAEMQATSIFYVPPRGAFDNAYLIDAGERLFSDNLLLKAPETERDIKQGARCIAFDLPTAVGFHFHRANEAVLRRYFDSVAGGAPRPENAPMGVLLGEMKKGHFGDKRVIAALDNIKEFHRNPLMHPEHTLENIDEAISLYCAIRAVMEYMLESLPFSFDVSMDSKVTSSDDARA